MKELIALLDETLALCDGCGEGLAEARERYEVGDDIEINTGDKVRSDVYGELWVTGTGGTSLWTSEDKADIKSGRGRGLRPSYVDAIQKKGKGPWIKVKIERGEDIGTVIE